MKPEDLLDPEHLPADLKWIASHHRLQPDDPVYLLIAWHWQRVKGSEDALSARTAELKATLDHRLETLRACTETIPGLAPTLRTLVERLEQQPLLANETIKEQLEAALTAAVVQLTDLEKRTAVAGKLIGVHRRRENVATFLIGLSLGMLAALAIFGA
ncbi:MAG: hypothetical protein KF715_19565 [Candidatus Didemnitutus sp.]|nr:hypothetical protein [Candidatus Didemnitutus sp.]